MPTPYPSPPASKPQAYDSPASETSDTRNTWPVFWEIVQARRSVRKFTGTAVPREVLDRCLDAALLSPNSSNLQPWEFWVIENPDLRKQLVPVCLNQNAAKTSGAMIAVLGRRNTWMGHAQAILADYPGGQAPAIMRTYYESHAPFVYGQRPYFLKSILKRLVFTLRGLRTPIARQPVTVAEQKTWITKTCALACQTFMLAAKAQGYDTCPMEGFDEKRATRLLKLPTDAFIVMFIAVGQQGPKGVYGERYRVPREHVVRYL